MREMTHRPVSLLLLSNMTVLPLKECLEDKVHALGRECACEIGTYDSILQESERCQAFDLTIIFWEACHLTRDLHARILTLSEEEIHALEQHLQQQILLLFSRLKSAATVIMNLFSARYFSADALHPGRLAKLTNSLNEFVRIQKPDNMLLFDTDHVIANISASVAFSELHFSMSQMLYSPEFFRAYADALDSLLDARFGVQNKAVVFDCDNTLWGGILGEDGPGGLAMSFESVPGTYFASVQSEAITLAARGVFVCICSKNNEEDVRRVFESHPDMLLQPDHISLSVVNWDDKTTGLQEIARRLNISLSSLVFIDDSEFEINMVRELLPEVTCHIVPRHLHQYPAMMRKVSSSFFTSAITEEDLHRTSMQQIEAQRERSREAFSDVTEYLRSLELQLLISEGENINCRRVSQLFGKTNQFNLTTRRYSEAETRVFIDSKDYRMFSCSVEDIFGSYGTVGVALAQVTADGNAILDSFLLSCRALGRQLEYAFLRGVLSRLKSSGVQNVTGIFIPSDRNQQTENFYMAAGFTPFENTPGRRTFVLELERADLQSDGIVNVQSG